MGLADRVRRLETGDGSSCSECGWGDPNVPIEVVWDDVTVYPEGPEHHEPEFCSTCGRPTEIVVTWGDGVEGPTPEQKERYEHARREHEENMRRLRGDNLAE